MSNDGRQRFLQLRRANGTLLPATIPQYGVPVPLEAPIEAAGLGEITGPLWRNKVMIVTIAVLGLVLGEIVTLIMKPTYRARASVQIEGISSDPFINNISLSSPLLPNSTPENYLQNEVKVLESETLAKRVADKLELPVEPAGRNWLSFLRWQTPSPAERRIRKVEKALTVRTSLESQVIDLFYDAEDPALATRGANAVTTEFINLNREAREQNARETTDWLNQQAATLKDNLEKSNRQLQDFARSAGLVFAGEPSTLAQDRMRQIQDALAKADEERATKQARLEAAQARPNDLLPDAVASGPLRSYQADLQGLRKDLAQLETLYTPTNYKVQKVKAQIAETEKAIETERKQTLGQLQTEYQAADKLDRMLADAQARQLKTIQRQMEDERSYDLKKSEADATEKLYESTLEKIKEAGIASALRTTNVRVLDSAAIPSVPYSPNPILNMAIGLVIGALGGVGFVVIREGSSVVKRPGETALFDVPELGVIPAAKSSEYPMIRRIGDVMETVPLTDREGSVLAESFRSTLTSILLGAGQPQGPGGRTEGRVLVVTSVDVMEGKTTIVTNLAAAAAERKQRVLVIDTDLRRPSVHERLNVSNAWGLTDMLQRGDFTDFVNQSPVEAMVRPSRIANLSVLPSGPIDSSAAGLLYASDMKSLLRRFRTAFDLILLDTPPLMLYADARLLGRMSDGVVMVVRAARRSREDLQTAYLRLMQDQIQVVGTILNDWKMDSSAARVYSRYYDHSHSRPA